MKRSTLLDEITISSKNLYNVATYVVRQRFFETCSWLRYHDLWKKLKTHECYLNLQMLCGSHPPQQVLRQVDHNFKSFFKAMKEWKNHPLKFKTMPRLPRYKRKNGHNIVYFTSQQCRMKDGQIYLTRKMEKLGFPKISAKIPNLNGVRIVPFGDRYTIELIYFYKPEDMDLSKNNVLGIDLGLQNAVTASNNIGRKPMIIKGGILKSINQYYNKKLAIYKSITKTCNNTYVTNRILKLNRKRKNKIRDQFHKTSRLIINYCIANDIGKIVIGYNKGWKQRVHLGKKNNQQFVSIPFLTLIHQIEYKAKMRGIDVIRTSEQYTSQKCSNCDIILRSNRKYRGLYVCSRCGLVINADVNAAMNIMKKEVPESVKIGDRGCLNHPVVLTV